MTIVAMAVAVLVILAPWVVVPWMFLRDRDLSVMVLVISLIPSAFAWLFLATLVAES